MPSPITFRGKTYSSKAALCSKYNIATQKFVDRYTRMGWSIEEALGLVPRDNRGKHAWLKAIKFRGIWYNSHKELCAAYNVKPSLYSGRRARGWTKAEALGLKARFGKADKQNGVIYMIVNKITKERYIGLTVKSVEERLAGHFSKAADTTNKTKLAVALRSYPRSAFKIKAIATASSQKCLAKLEKKYIKKYDTVNRGYNSNQGGAIGGVLNRIEFEGKIYSSLMAVCRAYGVKYNTVQGRLEDGMSLSEAIHTPKMCSLAKPRDWNGKTYPSLVALCKEHNFPYNLVRDRLYKGKSLEKALSTF